MRKMAIVLLVLVLQMVPGVVFAAPADAPHQVAGIVLGTPLDQSRHLINMQSAQTVRLMEYLSEAEMKPVPGYRTGYVTFGTCSADSPIIKIKLKYLRDDRPFFDELLKLFEKKFGKATKYKGDVFGGFLAWKWSLKDKAGNDISITLQHNSTDDDEYTSGNSLKMSITNLIRKERECYAAKAGGAGHPGGPQPEEKSDLGEMPPEELLPR